MDAEEARRRNIHKILSSKALIEALDKLTVNKDMILKRHNKSLADINKQAKVKLNYF